MQVFGRGRTVVLLLCAIHIALRGQKASSPRCARRSSKCLWGDCSTWPLTITGLTSTVAGASQGLRHGYRNV